MNIIKDNEFIEIKMNNTLLLKTITDKQFNDYMTNITKADIDKYEENGFAMLHYTHSNINRLRAILDKRPDVNIKDKTHYGNTPLHWGTTCHVHWFQIELLLEYGASPYIKNNYGRDVFEQIEHVKKDKNYCSCEHQNKCLNCWSVTRLDKYIMLISNYQNHHRTLFSMMFSDIDEYNLNKKRRFH